MPNSRIPAAPFAQVKVSFTFDVNTFVASQPQTNSNRDCYCYYHCYLWCEYNDNVNGTKSGTRNKMSTEVKEVERIGTINTNVNHKPRKFQNPLYM